MHRTRNRNAGGRAALWVGALLMAVLSTPAAAQSVAGVEVVYDHATQRAEPGGMVVLREGQVLSIRIINTETDCFDFDFKAVAVERDDKKVDALADGTPTIEPDFDDPYAFPSIVHDGKAWDYHVYITRKSAKELARIEASKGYTVALSEACDERSPRPVSDPWVVNVRSYGWKMGFAGGFTGDQLTDPVFALKPATREVGDETEQGFTILNQPEAEDDFALGAAGMVHVFHSNPNKPVLRWWAPVSFGLSVNKSSDVRYFLGTSLRFNEHLFLTVGGAFGSVDRLPTGLDLTENNFTADANALQNLGSRTKSSIFFGVSYTFLGDASKKAFQEALPKTPSSGGEKTPAGNGNDKKDGDKGKGDGDGSGQTGKDTSAGSGLAVEPNPLPRLEYQLGAPEPARATFEVSNPGKSALALEEFVLVGADGFWVDFSACPGSLDPGAKCDVAVEFRAEATGRSEAAFKIRTKAGEISVGLAGDTRDALD